MFSDGFRLCDWEKEKMIELERVITIENAKRDGLRMGKRQGRKEGRIEGRAEGRAEGIEFGIISTIKSMIKKNFTPEAISEITGKSIKEIETIQKNMI